MNLSKALFLVSIIAIAINTSPAKAQVASINRDLGPKFNEQFKLMLTHSLRDEFEVVSRAGQTMLNAPKDARIVDIEHIQGEYDKNEVAGDLKFRRKPFIVYGKIESIDRSIGENYYISFIRGEHQLTGPKARMADGNVQFLAGLSKGEELSLSCQGAELMMKSVIVSGCQPIGKWIEAQITKTINTTNLKSLAKDDPLRMVLLISHAYAIRLPADTKCASDKTGDTCFKEGVETLKAKTFTEAEKVALTGKYGVSMDIFRKPDAEETP